MTVRRSSLKGSLRAPPSKSYTHRALFCSALAQGESKIHSPLSCHDTHATSDALSKIGVTTQWSRETARVSRSAEFRKPSGAIFCRESGTTLRFMTAICAATPHEAEISGRHSLLKRPVKDLAVALGELGAYCTTDNGFPPVYVKGPMKGGSVKVPGNISSQYVSALLLAAPLAEHPVEISISGRLESRSYVEMTVDMLNKFGVDLDASDDLTQFRVSSQVYRPSEVEIEGDWSSAAFPLAGGATCGEEVTIQGLDMESLQSDRCLIDLLERMKGRVSRGLQSVTVRKSQLEPVEIDVSDCPDLFPVACVLCAITGHVSTIKGIRRLRIKESNRVQAMSEGLGRMGIRTDELEDSLIVHGGRPQKAAVDPRHDHRIAMAFALLGLCAEEVTILDADCVGKSYPSFWSDLQALGAKVTTS